MTLNYFNYFTEIEEHFVRKRARNLLISPLDWCLIELWKENGIPLHVVLRGIDRSFESAQERRRSSPKTLFYCHPAVIEAFEEYQEAVLGESTTVAGVDNENGGSGLSRESVLRSMDDLREQLKLREGEAFVRAVSRISALSSEVSVRADLDLREVDADLAEISSMLTESLREDLDDETWKTILTECRKELKIYRRHLAPEMFERLKQKQIERSIREHFHLPDFSLLHCE
jgi:hypothetical protein